MNHEMSVTRRVDALALCPVLRGAPRNDLRLLGEMTLALRVSRGATLFSEGETADGVYVIVSGRMGVLPPGRSSPTRVLGPGELLGEYGMAANTGRTATVRAEEDAELLFVDYPRFRAFLIQCPESLYLIFQTAARRLAEAERRGVGDED